MHTRRELGALTTLLVACLCVGHVYCGNKASKFDIQNVNTLDVTTPEEVAMQLEEGDIMFVVGEGVVPSAIQLGTHLRSCKCLQRLLGNDDEAETFTHAAIISSVPAMSKMAADNEANLKSGVDSDSDGEAGVELNEDDSDAEDHSVQKTARRRPSLSRMPTLRGYQDQLMHKIKVIEAVGTGLGEKSFLEGLDHVSSLRIMRKVKAFNRDGQCQPQKGIDYLRQHVGERYSVVDATFSAFHPSITRLNDPAHKSWFCSKAVAWAVHESGCGYPNNEDGEKPLLEVDPSTLRCDLCKEHYYEVLNWHKERSEDCRHPFVEQLTEKDSIDNPHRSKPLRVGDVVLTKRSTLGDAIMSKVTHTSSCACLQAALNNQRESVTYTSSMMVTAVDGGVMVTQAVQASKGVEEIPLSEAMEGVTDYVVMRQQCSSCEAAKGAEWMKEQVGKPYAPLGQRVSAVLGRSMSFGDMSVPEAFYSAQLVAWGAYESKCAYVGATTLANIDTNELRCDLCESGFRDLFSFKQEQAAVDGVDADADADPDADAIVDDAEVGDK